jgi:hypothetical protein
VRFGRIYAYAMAAMVLTGVPLAARGLSSPLAARRSNALFLFYIALLAAESSWTGLRALRASRQPGPPGALELAPPLALTVGGVSLLASGLAHGSVLHVFFALLGSALGMRHIAFWRRAARSRTDAIVAHLNGMGVSAIVTLTAFLVTNARYLFGLGAFTVAVWITPAVTGAIAIGVAQRRWREREAARTEAAGPTGTTAR